MQELIGTRSQNGAGQKPTHSRQKASCPISYSGRIVGERAAAIGRLNMLLERVQCIRTQQRNDKNKLYAQHAPEVEYIGKGKARKPYEFGVKVSIAVTHKNGLVVGARSSPGNPYDGHILLARLEQTKQVRKSLLK